MARRNPSAEVILELQGRGQEEDSCKETEEHRDRGIFAVTVCRILVLEAITALVSGLWGIGGSPGKELGW